MHVVIIGFFTLFCSCLSFAQSQEPWQALAKQARTKAATYIYNPDQNPAWPLPLTDVRRSRQGFPSSRFSVQAAAIAARPESEFKQLIRQHSAPYVEVLPGQKVELKVIAKSEQGDLSYRWEHHGKVLCQKSACLLDTDAWAVGVHRVQLVVMDSRQVMYLDFAIKVRFRLPDKKKRLIQPPLVDFTKASARLRAGGMYLFALKGNGLGKFAQNWRKIDSQILAINKWQGELKSHGVLKFGVGQRFGVFQLPRARVRLETLASGLKAIWLKHGLLRLRYLDRSGANFAVLIDDWAQIDAAGWGDVMVMRSPKSLKKTSRPDFTVACLTGRCRISVKGETKLITGELSHLQKLMAQQKSYARYKNRTVYFLAAGEVVRLSKTQNRLAAITIPKAKGLQQLVQATTPSHLDFAELSKGLQLPIKNLSQQYKETQRFIEPKQKSPQLQTLQANAHQWPLMEVLAGQLAKAALTPEKHYIIAQMYLRLQLYQAASYHFSEAESHRFFGPLSELNQAMLLMLLGDWQQGEAAFDAIEGELPPLAEKQRRYYQGVCRYFAGETTGSIEMFKAAQDIKGLPAVQESAGLFIKAAERLRTWQYLAELAAGRSTKPLMNSDAYARSQNFLVQPDYLVLADLDLSYRLIYEDLAWLKLGWSNQVKAFVPYYASILNYYRSRFYLKTHLQTQVETVNSWRFSLQPFLERVGRGQAALDGFGLELRMGWPMLGLQPEVWWANEQYLDPEPFQEKYLDPLDGGYGPATDRSARFYVYGVGLTPWQQGGSRFDAKLVSRQRLFRRDSSRQEDYQSLLLDLELKYMLRPKILGHGALSYEQKSLPDFEGGRRDQGWQLRLGGDWLYAPHSLLGGFWHKSQRSSSQEGYGYGLDEYGLRYATRN